MKNILNKIKENYKLIIGVFITGLLFGYLFFHSSNEGLSTGHEDHKTEIENQIWTCSMHPQIKQNKPGKCPICAMDLIPLTAMGATGDDVSPNEIIMTESAAMLASIQTMPVTKGVPEKTVYLQGKVQADERKISVLTARFGGRIEKLFVNFTGQNVTKGEKLATIYSPELVTAQRELLEAVSFKENRPSLYTAAVGKLKLWDLTNEQISDIEKRGEPQIYFDVLSPISGTVTMKHVVIGDYVKEGDALFQVIDLTKVWVMFDAYESDLPWIKIGDQVDFTIQSVPGKSYSAKVTFIDLLIDAQTRVTKVRVEVENPQLTLKPEMFTVGLLESKIAEGSNEIIVPKSAILWTGKRSVVYVKVQNRESPSFLYREVVLGPEAGAFYVIAEGLKEGEEIAINGVFKIDAASQLQGLPSMMNPDGGKIATGHNHGETPMSAEEMKKMDEKKPTSKIKADKAPMEFKMQLGKVVESYLKMKDALVESNEQATESSVRKTLEALAMVDMSLLKGDAHNMWIRLHKPIKDNLEGMIQMKGLEMKRSHFSIVSDKLTEALETLGYHSSKEGLYLEFCPMAFDNKGAFWLSNSKDIRNPYFGDAMLKCGEVKKEF